MVYDLRLSTIRDLRFTGTICPLAGTRTFRYEHSNLRLAVGQLAGTPSGSESHVTVLCISMLRLGASEFRAEVSGPTRSPSRGLSCCNGRCFKFLVPTGAAADITQSDGSLSRPQ
jgi:hypothetical protein